MMSLAPSFEVPRNAYRERNLTQPEDHTLTMSIGGRNLWSVLDEYLTPTPSRTLTTCGKIFEWKSGMNFQLTAKSVLNWGIQTYDQR
jgi:hypothetical protein